MLEPVRVADLVAGLPAAWMVNLGSDHRQLADRLVAYLRRFLE